jgi:hypothetical protein
MFRGHAVQLSATSIFASFWICPWKSPPPIICKPKHIKVVKRSLRYTYLSSPHEISVSRESWLYGRSLNKLLNVQLHAHLTIWRLGSLLKFLKVAHSYLKFTWKQTVVAEQFLFRLGLISINWPYTVFFQQMLATGRIRHKHFLNLTYLLLNIYNTPKNFPKDLPNFYIHTAKFRPPPLLFLEGL